VPPVCFSHHHLQPDPRLGVCEMPSLREVLAQVTQDNGAFTTEAPEGWTQGRTVYGGMNAALCAHAAAVSYPQLPPLRSAHISFIAPAFGSLRYVPQLLREGRTAAVVSVDCFADGKLACRASFTYGAERESKVIHDRVPLPEVPGWQDCEPPEPPRREGFFQYFENRPVSMKLFTPGEPPEMVTWMRLRDAAGVDPTIALLAIADSLPPAALVAFPEPAPISTMTWSIDLRQPLETPGWLLIRSSSEHAASGYSQQSTTIWTADGIRIATSGQTVAIFA
jgi:acyl-CoA thioesterase